MRHRKMHIHASAAILRILGAFFQMLCKSRVDLAFRTMELQQGLRQVAIIQAVGSQQARNNLLISPSPTSASIVFP